MGISPSLMFVFASPCGVKDKLAHEALHSGTQCMTALTALHHF